MQKTDTETRREIERLFERYQREVAHSHLAWTPSEQDNRAEEEFVFWIRGTYNPGDGPWQ